METEGYTCKYCLKSFKRESTLASHMCEQKRRWLSKDEKGVALGLHVYVKFYEYSQNSAKKKTFEDFATSPYYSAFVRFGNYIVKTKCIKVDRFINWVIRSGIKLDHWAKDSTYTKFLDEALKTENVSDALERAIEYSIDWGNEKEMRPEDVLRYGSTNRLCYAINSGKLSPWVLYNSDSGQEFLSKLNKEQMEMIWEIIDPDYWNTEFEKKSEDVQWSRKVLADAGW